MTRHDVDGHLWKGRIGVKHTQIRREQSLFFIEGGKKKNHIQTTGGRSSRRDQGSCVRLIVGLTVEIFSWKVWKSLTGCCQGYRRDERPRASHVYSRGSRSEAPPSSGITWGTTSTLPISSTFLFAAVVAVAAASPPLLRPRTWLPNRRRARTNLDLDSSRDQLSSAVRSARLKAERSFWILRARPAASAPGSPGASS